MRHIDRALTAVDHEGIAIAQVRDTSHWTTAGDRPTVARVVIDLVLDERGAVAARWAQKFAADLVASVTEGDATRWCSATRTRPGLHVQRARHHHHRRDQCADDREGAPGRAALAESPGRPARVMTAVSLDTAAYLPVVGARSEHSLRGLLVGRVVDQLLHHAPRPVAIIARNELHTQNNRSEVN